MKHIAILTCLDACKVCTGASCLKAWNDRTRGFAPYAGEEAQLDAFFHCNGCSSQPEDDPGMREKLDRLQSMGVTAVHTGVCTCKGPDYKAYCPNIAQIVSLLEQRGIQVIRGTH